MAGAGMHLPQRCGQLPIQARPFLPGLQLRGRLLDDEGIYWYFEQSAGQHKLVLVDDPCFHEPAPGCEKLSYYGNAVQVPPGKEAKDWKTAMNQFAKLYEDRFTRAANGTA